MSLDLQGWSDIWRVAPLMGMAVGSEALEASIQLSALPYAQDALEPTLSARTMVFHYGKHHQAYVDNLNKLISGTPLDGQSLATVIRTTEGKADQVGIFTNAARSGTTTSSGRV